jgi:hypothetical protein
MSKKTKEERKVAKKAKSIELWALRCECYFPVMLCLITRRMHNCKSDPEQSPDEGAGRIVPAPALEAEVIPQDAPRGLRDVGVMVGKEIDAAIIHVKLTSKVSLSNEPPRASSH